MHGAHPHARQHTSAQPQSMCICPLAASAEGGPITTPGPLCAYKRPVARTVVNMFSSLGGCPCAADEASVVHRLTTTPEKQLLRYPRGASQDALTSKRIQAQTGSERDGWTSDRVAGEGDDGTSRRGRYTQREGRKAPRAEGQLVFCVCWSFLRRGNGMSVIRIVCRTTRTPSPTHALSHIRRQRRRRGAC